MSIFVDLIAASARKGRPVIPWEPVARFLINAHWTRIAPTRRLASNTIAPILALWSTAASTQFAPFSTTLPRANASLVT